MNLIYQYWNGKIPPIALSSKESVKDYAALIGAEYRFDHNEKFSKELCSNSTHYGILAPLYVEWFWQFDNVLFLDCDIFVVDDIEEDIFKVKTRGFSMCQEPHQPELRAKHSRNICGANDQKWAHLIKKLWGISVPRNVKNQPLVFNSGVVLFSNDFMTNGREFLLNPQTYIDSVKRAGFPPLYATDQNYLHAVAFREGVPFSEMDCEWNRQLQCVGPNRDFPKREVYDGRTKSTKFVHVQLSGAKNWDKKRLWKVVNLPQFQWEPL